MDGLHAALNMLAFGVVLLDRRERVVLLNDAAGRMSKESIGIRKREHLLDVIWSPDRQHFQTTIERACSWAPMRNLQPLLLRDEKGKAVAVMFAHSLYAADDADHASLQFAAVLFVRSLNGQTRVTRETLRSLFRMTEAEARLVTALYAGATLTEASRSLGKSVSTLRTQLRAAFDKTNTRRQVELLRVIDRVVRP